MAVTKTFDLSLVRAAAAAGITAVGENYVEELEAKRRDAGDLELSWHYLGALQSNKIARIVRVADIISGVSRAKEVLKIAALRPGAVVDIQVDLTGRANRNGASAAETPALVDLAREAGLAVRGLMIVASPEPGAAREEFRRVDELAREVAVRERSMGMSDDFEIAVAEGSTEIRVGRVLFGPRTARATLA